MSIGTGPHLDHTLIVLVRKSRFGLEWSVTMSKQPLWQVESINSVSQRQVSMDLGSSDPREGET